MRLETTRACVRVCWGVPFLALSLVGFQAPLSLSDNVVFDRVISASGKHVYSLALRAGETVDLQIEEKRVDVELALLTPEGGALVKSSRHEVWKEEIVYQSAGDASYQVTITAGSTHVDGGYRLRCRIHQQLDENERLRIEAQSLSFDVSSFLNAWSASQWTAELKKLEEAKRLWARLNDKDEVAYALLMNGIGTRRLGQHKQSVVLAEEALSLFRTTKNEAGEAAALTSLAIAEGLMGEREKSAGEFREVVSLYEKQNSPVSLARAYANLGASLTGTPHVDETTRALRKAALMSKELGLPKIEAQASANLADQATDIGKFEEGVAYGSRAVQIFRQIDDKESEGVALISLGSSEQGLGNASRALADYERSYALRRELQDREGMAFSLQYTGRALSDLGRYEEAISKLKEAETILIQTDNRVNYSALLRWLAATYRLTGRFDDAFETLQKAIVVSREQRVISEEANSLSDTALLLYAVRDDNRAIQYARRALDLSRSLPNEERLTALNTLGNAYLRQEDSTQAIHWLKELLSLAITAKDKVDETAAQLGLAKAYRQQGKITLAELTLRKAFKTAQGAENKNLEATVLSELGDLLLLSDATESRRCLRDAFSIYRQAKIAPSESRVLFLLARLDRQQGRIGTARDEVEESLRITESLRARIFNPASRLTWFASAQEANKLYIEILMTLYEQHRDERYAAMAFEASERERARTLLDSLQDHASSMRTDERALLLAREKKVAEQLDASEAQRTKLLFSNHGEEAKALELEIGELSSQLEQIEANVRRGDSNLTVSESQSLSLAQIQGALDPSTLLLEYSLGAQRSFLWLVGRGSFQSFDLPREQTIDEAATQVSRIVASVKAQEPEEGKELQLAVRHLSKMIVAPVIAKLGENALAIVSDGALHSISFAMLSDSARLSYRPLVLHHEITMAPSASFIVRRRGTLMARAQPSKMAAIFADPVFSIDDQRVERNKGQPGKALDSPPSEERLLKHIGSILPVRNQISIPRLPFTLLEANRIAVLVPAAERVVNLGFEANRASVTSPGLNQYRYLHFATHGWLDPDYPENSALVLSLVDRKGNSQEGVLSTRNVYNLNLDADLVTLSACETGLGKRVEGEGLVGLTQAFLEAGAARVAVSYWNVNDQATAELMSDFYTNLLARHLRPAAALKAAQIKVLGQQRWASPYFWAAFTLHGEWQ